MTEYVSNRVAWIGYSFHYKEKKSSLYEQVKWYYDAIKAGRWNLSLSLFKRIEVGIPNTMTDKELAEFDLDIEFESRGVNKKDILFVFKDDTMTRAKLASMNEGRE